MNPLDAAELRQAGRLAAAGAVGAGVAHELRNSLAVAESALFLAQRDVEDRPKLLRHLDQIGAELRKAHNVIGSVLGLARGEPVRREPTEVTRLIELARQGLVLAPDVRFEIAVAPADLSLTCDAILFERVLANLYINALEALGGHGGQGTVTTRAWRDDERTHIEVEDDGPGLDPSVCPCVFEPLVTSKPSGTGLGLALTRAIVEAHGGEISTAKGERRGCTFRIWLPNE